MTDWGEPSGWDLMLAPPQPTERTTMAYLASVIAAQAGVTVETLRGPDKHQHASMPRQAFMFAAHESGYSATQIGQFLGGRDHSTILHGIARHRDRLAAGIVDGAGRIMDRPAGAERN